MKAVHHPGIHFGEFDIDWESLIVPLGAILMIAVILFLAGGEAGVVPVSGLIDVNLAP